MDPDITTISCYRSDRKILREIAKKHDLLDLKNHPSVREALHFILKHGGAEVLDGP